MPTYQVTDPDTGRKLKLTGDSPPTEQELEEIFSQFDSPTPQSLPEFQTIEGNEVLFGSQFGDKNTGFLDILQDAGASLITFNPKARIDQIRNNMPHLEVEEFGDGNAIIRNPENDGITVLNSENLSMADLSPFLTSAFGGGLGAKAIEKSATTAGKMMTGAGIAAGMDTALQLGEIALGSEQGFDKGRLALSAGLGGFMAPMPGIAADKLQRIRNSKFVQDVAPSVEALKNRASQLYRELDEAGVVVKKSYVQNLSNKVLNRAKKEGFRERMHPKVAAALEDFAPENIGNKTLEDLMEYRVVMRNAAASNEPSEQRIGQILKDEIDDTLDELTSLNVVAGNAKGVGPKLSEARSLWHRAKKSDQVAQLMELARLAGVGEEQGIRQEFRRQLKRIAKGQDKGWTQVEIDALQKVADGTKTSNIIKAMGKFGVLDTNDPRAMMATLGGIAGGTIVGDTTGAILVPLIGQVSRKTALKLTQKNARLADTVVRAGKDGRKIAIEYMRQIPRKDWDAEELSEIMLTRKVPASTLKTMSEKGIKPARELAKKVVGLMSAGSLTATPAAAEELTQ